MDPNMDRAMHDQMPDARCEMQHAVPLPVYFLSSRIRVIKEAMSADRIVGEKWR